MEKQERRCAKCRDLLGGRWEVHHDPPVAEGGGSQDVCLVCPTCHAEETEKQELKGGTAPQYFESQLNPDMMRMFQETPRPRQLCWGDPAARAKALASDDFTPLACLDIRGCRRNALLTRKWLPVGSPLDTVVPVFDSDGECYLTSFEDYQWLWVEVEVQEKRPTLCTMALTFTRWKRCRCSWRRASWWPAQRRSPSAGRPGAGSCRQTWPTRGTVLQPCGKRVPARKIRPARKR